MRKVFIIFKEVIMFIRNFLMIFVEKDDSKIGGMIRKRRYNTKCYIDTSVVIRNSTNFSAANGCSIYHATYILNTKGKFIMGNNSHLGAFCYVNVAKGNINIGDDVAVGPGTKIIAYSNHYECGKKVTEVRIEKNIVIKNNVFIGANCVILPGTIINENVVVGAGSVIKGELQSNSIYVGSPCRKIRSNWYA